MSLSIMVSLIVDVCVLIYRTGKSVQYEKCAFEDMYNLVTTLLHNQPIKFSHLINMLNNKKWIFVSRPEGLVNETHYRLETVEMVSDLALNEVIVESKFISVDPYMRINQAQRNTFDNPHPFGVVQGK
jgi:hypothetical protein